MEGAWSCYRGGLTNEEKMVVTEVVSLGRENGHVRELASLMEGEWSC